MDLVDAQVLANSTVSSMNSRVSLVTVGPNINVPACFYKGFQVANDYVVARLS